MDLPARRGTRLTEIAERARDRKRVLLLVTAVFLVLSIVAPAGIARVAMIASASALVFLTGFFFFAWRRNDLVDRIEAEAMSNFIAEDAIPSFITDDEGAVLFSNKAAARRCDSISETLSGALKQIFANPGPIVERLQSAVDDSGSAREEIVTRKGHIRLTAHRMGVRRMIWRLEDLQEAAVPNRNSAPQLPMLVLGRSDTILSMNDAARQLIGQRVKTLDRIFSDLPVRYGQRNEITSATGRSFVVPCEVDAGAGRRALYLVPSEPEEQSEGWQAIEELPVPLLRVSPEGDVRAYNDSAKNLLGNELAEGVLLSELMEGLGRSIRDWLRDTADGRAGQNSEFLRLRRLDKEVFVQVTLTPVETGKRSSLIAILNDATELKTLEAQFVQSQKMQAIGQLAGGVAHDFNNLLTAISGHCDLLLLRHDQGDPDFADLVQINQNANRAAALVSQLLAFSRKQTLRPKTIDMRDTLADLTHLLNRLVGERVSLQTSYDPVLPPIRADKRQLEQVLMNLVVNARDAMPNGGEIKVTCEFAELPEPLTRDNATVPAGGYVRVTVADEGIGIASDKLQKVFEPFYTTKRTDEGTGLGLSTAYGIVKQTGGFIFVDSEVGKGTTFTLYLPAQDRKEEVAEDKVKQPEAAKATATHGEGVILLVEDEAPVRAFASRALRKRRGSAGEAAGRDARHQRLRDGRGHARHGRPVLGAESAEDPARHAGGLRLRLCRRQFRRDPVAHSELSLPSEAVFSHRSCGHGAPSTALTARARIVAVTVTLVICAVDCRCAADMARRMRRRQKTTAWQWIIWAGHLSIAVRCCLRH
jgi:two-component system cell cycle sensor histidine kinase/response regulator CckA